MEALNFTKDEFNTVEQLFLNGELKYFMKGEVILKPNRTCRHLYFIKKGLIRTFYINTKDKDISHWFSVDNSIITILSNFNKQKTTIYGLQALEDTEVLCLKFEDFEAFRKSNPDISELFQRILMDVAIKIADRMVDFQVKTAKERYDKLINEHPNIFMRIKLGYIASYLGMTQQSLSRVRSC